MFVVSQWFQPDFEARWSSSVKISFSFWCLAWVSTELKLPLHKLFSIFHGFENIFQGLLCLVLLNILAANWGWAGFELNLLCKR
jgi:hypothetical protein